MKRLLVPLLLATAFPAFANVTVCVGDAASCLPAGWDVADLDEIHFDEANAIGTTSATGTPQSGAPYTVLFESTELFTHGAGFATLKGVDGLLNDVTFSTQPAGLIGFEVAEFDLLNNGFNGEPQLATVDFSWNDSDGASGASLGVNMGPGTTTFTVFASPETLVDFTIESLQGFEVAQFKHLSIDPDLIDGGDPDPQSVSAPGHMALLAMGLVGLVAGRIKRK